MRVSNFDNPSGPLKINGVIYDAQWPRRSYAITQPNNKQLRMEVRENDPVFPSDATKGADRAEVSMREQIPQRRTVELSYQFRVEPGNTPTSDWTIIGQWHAKDNDLDEDGDIDGTSPPVHIAYGRSNKLIIIGRSGYPTPGGSLPIVCSYTSSNSLPRDKWHEVALKTRFMRTKAGRLRAWLNGAKVLDYDGPLGYDTVNRWKFGIYRKTQPFPIAVCFRNYIFNILD